MVVVIDPQIAGISGDMLLCSLVDLGADKNKIINGIKESEKFLSNSTIKNINFVHIQKHKVQSVSLVLDIDEALDERSGSEIRTAIINSVQALKLSPKASMFAQSCIDTLISAESKIHGIPKDSVHFHEASGIDTLVDIVGVAIALQDLGLFDEEILCLPVSVGGGHVAFSHGIMSNPASAILEIFKDSNLTITGSDAKQELATPTGACILVNITCKSVGHYPAMKVESVGYGAGQRDFETFANVLKIVRGSQGNFKTDSVKILETNVDDVSGEILGNLIEKIMNKGARDVSIYSGITKKGRPTNLVSVICTDKTLDAIADTLVLETGTLGIRITDSSRFIVPRSNHNISLTLDGQRFQVRYKKTAFKGKTDFKIEFDDLRHISDTVDKPIKETEALLRREIVKLET